MAFFSSGLLTETLYSPLPCPIGATFPAQLILVFTLQFYAIQSKLLTALQSRPQRREYYHFLRSFSPVFLTNVNYLCCLLFTRTQVKENNNNFYNEVVLIPLGFT